MYHKKFTPANCQIGIHKPQGLSAKPFCSISARGIILISSGAAALWGLKDGDRIAFWQDQQYPSDWYIVKDPDGFTLRKMGGASTKKNFLRFESYELASLILGTLNGFSSDYNKASYPLKVIGDKLALCPKDAKMAKYGGSRYRKTPAGFEIDHKDL